jgi:FkbM family methyltransferase
MDPRYAIRIVREILNHPMNRHHKTAAIIRVLQWQVRSRLDSQPVVVQYVNGSKLLVKRGMSSAIANIYTGIFEYQDMAFVLHVLRPGDLFIDVGANVGTFSILGGLTGANVVAFEPVEETFKALSANLRLNGLHSQVEARRIGIASMRGTLEFTAEEDSTNHVAGGRWPDGNQKIVAVEVTTLDDALKDLAPTMLKIDVEGYETEVIRGATQTLALPSLLSVIVELNGSGDRYAHDERKVHEALLALDFQPFDYDPANRQLSELTWHTRRRSNILYLRDVEWARERVANAPHFCVHGQRV